MTGNPYTPPQTPIEQTETDSQRNAWVPDFMSNKQNHILARRWGGSMIDFIVCIALLMIPAKLLGNQTANESAAIWLWGLPIVYFAFMEGLTGYTIGKFICRTKVVDQYGQVPGLNKALTRTFLRLLEVNPILLGGVPAGVAIICSKKGQRIGDMVAETYVIPIAALKQHKTVI